MKLKLQAHIATGIKPPKWIEELWDHVVQKTFKEATNMSKFINEDAWKNKWGSKGELSIYISEFCRDHGFKNSNMELQWISELHPDAKYCSGRAIRKRVDYYYDKNTKDKYIDGKIQIVLPMDVMSKIMAGVEYRTHNTWGEGSPTYTTKIDINYKILDPFKSTFVHELAHLQDISVNYRNTKIPYPTDEDWEKDYELANKMHKKHKTEWRAHLSEIRYELKDRDDWEPSWEVSEYLTATSDTWNRIKKYLPAKGRRYILQAIGSDLANYKYVDSWSKVNKENPLEYHPAFMDFLQVEGLWKDAKSTLGAESPEAKWLRERLDTFYKDKAEDKDPEAYYDIDVFNDCTIGDNWRYLDNTVKRWIWTNFKKMRRITYWDRENKGEKKVYWEVSKGNLPLEESGGWDWDYTKTR